MVISPNDFSLWSRLTGNKYPSTPRERAQKGPEVQRFIQNLGREGMLGGKQQQEKKKEKGLPEKLATGALIAGGIAAGVAAARDKRVQDVAQRAGSTVRDKTQQFLKNLGPGQEVDIEIVDASGDVTPDPRQQQSNIGAQVNKFLLDVPVSPVDVDTSENVIPRGESPFSASRNPSSEAEYIMTTDASPSKLYTEVDVKPVDSYTPLIQGKTYKTEGAISKEDPYGDIGNVSKRVDRTYGNLLEGFKNIPGVDVNQRRRQLTRETEKGRDFDIAYMVARGQGKDDTAATQTARAAAGLDTSPAVRPPTEYRKFLGEQKTGSIIKAKIDDLINMVQPGQITRVEGIDQSQLNKYGTWENNTQVSMNNNTPDNKVIKVGAEIGGPTLVDQHATEMAVDNALDNARDAYEKQISTIVEAGKTSGGSIKSRAGAEAFLQKYRTNVVKNLDEAIQKDLQATTGLNPEDAANIAGSIINPITGQREVKSVQKAGSKVAVKEATREPFNEKSIPNIDPETNQGIIKTAVGTAVRGRAPSYDQTRFVERTREDINDPKGGDLPDIQGGISGPSAQELLKRKSGELMQYTGKRPSGEVAGRDEETKLLGDRAPRTPVRKVISPAADQGSAGPGIDIYGEGLDYLAGPFSNTAEKAPTDTFGKTSPFKGVSDKRVEQFKADAKPGTKTFESADKELKGRASIDIARQLRQIQTTGNPETVNERTNAFFDKLDPTGELRKRNRG